MLYLTRGDTFGEPEEADCASSPLVAIIRIPVSRKAITVKPADPLAALRSWLSSRPICGEHQTADIIFEPITAPAKKSCS